MAHKAWQELVKVNHAMGRVYVASESTVKVEQHNHGAVTNNLLAMKFIY